LHIWATERKKGKKWMQKTNFLADEKSLNHFIIGLSKRLAIRKIKSTLKQLLTLYKIIEDY
jgi:hypothetical protein